MEGSAADGCDLVPSKLVMTKSAGNKQQTITDSSAQKSASTVSNSTATSNATPTTTTSSTQLPTDSKTSASPKKSHKKKSPNLPPYENVKLPYTARDKMLSMNKRPLSAVEIGEGLQRQHGGAEKFVRTKMASSVSSLQTRYIPQCFVAIILMIFFLLLK